jgi:hypothetical protein
MTALTPILAKIISRFDELNARDPNLIEVDGAKLPRQLIYAQRLTRWVLTLSPNASENLQIAARAQHVRRWEISRADYPPDKAGYHQWKNRLKMFHAEVAGSVLRECGCPPEMIEAVEALNTKRNFPTDPEAQTLEDALCLMFLECQAEPMLEKFGEEKARNALRKSWVKMSPQAHSLVNGITFSAEIARLVQKTISPSHE